MDILPFRIGVSEDLKPFRANIGSNLVSVSEEESRQDSSMIHLIIFIRFSFYCTVVMKSRRHACEAHLRHHRRRLCQVGVQSSLTLVDEASR